MDAPVATPPPEATAGPDPAAPDPAAAELAGAMGWYDRSAGRSKVRYQSLRVLTMLLAASIPVVAALDGSTAITAVLGSSIVVIEGFQQLFQFHERWVGYRKTWNALDQERRLYESHAGPYAGVTHAGKRLSERTATILSAENTDWVALAASAAPENA
jgi:hypothetical protein